MFDYLSRTEKLELNDEVNKLKQRKLVSTVEPRYNQDPVITKNIWKPGRITVKYVEMNPAITNNFFGTVALRYRGVPLYPVSAPVN